MKTSALVVALALVAGSASAQPAIPTRTPLAVVPIAPAKPVSRVETTRVDFLPGQAMPRHKHTVPVVCFVVQGEFALSVGDQPEHKVGPGAVTYEPPEAVIHFRNASTTAPGQLNCASLAGEDDHVLNVMLP